MLTAHLAHLPERRAAVQRAKHGGLVPFEPHDRRLTRRAVHPNVGHLAHPPGQVGLQRPEGCEAPARDGVVLHVAHAALVLPLGAGPVGCAGHRPHRPVPGEGMEAIVELHLARGGIVVPDQRGGVVEEQLARQAAEVAERAFDALEPSRLPLVPERLDIDPSRVAERRHKQEDLVDLPILQRDPALAEIDLQLPARRRLEPHRRQRRRDEFAPQVTHGALHRPQARHHAQLRRQVLAHHVGIAVVSREALGDPAGMLVQHPGTLRHPTARPSTGGQVALHRLTIAPDFPRDPPRAPSLIVQPQDRHHLVRRSHPLSPPVDPGWRVHRNIGHRCTPCYAGGMGSSWRRRMGLPCRLTVGSNLGDRESGNGPARDAG